MINTKSLKEIFAKWLIINYLTKKNPNYFNQLHQWKTIILLLATDVPETTRKV